MSMIRPTFMGFETAKRGIEVNQKAIDIVGNNLSNTETIGYTRQRVDTASVSPASYSSRVASSRIGLTGQGVEALGVSQIRDSFLDKRFRDEYSKASYHGQSAEILNDIQSALGDGSDLASESSLFGAMQQIFNSINDYAYEPTMDSQANLVLSAFKNMTQVLQQLDAKLSGVANNKIYDVGVDVDRVNEIFNEIAHYNELISQDATVMANPNNEYFRPNELLDKRNVLLDELAGYGDINVVTLANGMVNVDFGGKRAVTEKDCEKLRLETNPDLTIDIKWVSSGDSVKLTGGSFQAARDYLNGRGNNLRNEYETTKQGIPYYRDRLNTFATAFANVVNNTIPERANPNDPGDNTPLLDANGNIVYKTLIGGRDSNGTVAAKGQGLITAANISISQEWSEGGPSYFIFSKQENIASYAQQISTSLTSDSHKFVSYGESFNGTFEEYISDYVTQLGSEIKFQEGRFEATSMVADDFLDRRDEVSGVNRDEETANMLIFQKSYNAAARMMTTLDDMLDVIINRMGRVGL